MLARRERCSHDARDRTQTITSVPTDSVHHTPVLDSHDFSTRVATGSGEAMEYATEYCRVWRG